jgi:MFS family permease
MSLASVGFAAGLGLLSQAQGAGQLFLAWSLLGMAMAGGLYEAAFATVVKFDPAGARRAITGITLMGGLASTVGWPLTAWLTQELGWRGACLVWAALHVGVNLPIHLWLRPRSVQPDKAQANSVQTHSSSPGYSTLPAHHHRRAATLLASTFALTWFISTAMAAHLPVLLQAQGMTLATAVWLGSLMGPAHVLARMAEYSLLKHVHPLLSARLAADGKDFSGSPVPAAHIAELVALIEDGTISSKIAKEVFDHVWNGEGSPGEVVEKHGLKQVTDAGAIEKAVDEIIAANPDKAAAVAEKPQAIGWFVGQVMKATGGKANPAVVNQMVAQKLGL